MGHRHHHHLPETQHHQSVDGLVNLFTKGNHDLTVIQHKLEKEFQQIYPDSANPMKLVSRIKKVQEELSSMKEQCRELLAAKQFDEKLAKSFTKLQLPNQEREDHGYFEMLEMQNIAQDLIDKARTTLVGNRTLLQRLQASTGVPVTSDSDDPAFTSFNQIIDEWTAQVRFRAEDERPDSGSEDINQMLFSAIVQGT
ncbi:unnamed protein product [Ilex paraguariensis]|uniref:Protein FAM33A n=1 Tax=Ilex paraguariensis TaxID=185542 RepID=A0ABC8QMR6_9AQUA